jgi:hypothetical protein
MLRCADESRMEKKVDFLLEHQKSMEEHQKSMEDSLFGLRLEMKEANRQDLTSPSPADRGDRLLQEAKRQGTFTEFLDTAGEEDTSAILPLREKLRNATEAILNVELCRHLGPILGELGLVLVNSEKLKWIPVRPAEDTSKYDLMPDLFACRPSLYSAECEYNTSSDELRELRSSVSITYGKPFWAVRDSIGVVFETKKNFDIAGLSELVNYQARICKDSGCESKGAFVWNEGFMLTRVDGARILSIQQSTWHAAGSKMLFSNFAVSNKPSWLLALEQLPVTLVNHGFLGRGSRGRVFLVDVSETCRGAVKVVVGERDVEELRKEYDVITSYARRNHQLPVVSLQPSVGVLEVSNVFASISRTPGVAAAAAYAMQSVGAPAPYVPAAAYVMQSVGAPAPYGTRATKLAICSALCQLHSNEIVHGDARKENVIIIDEGLIWIDFMASHLCSSAIEIKQDMDRLMRSLHGMAHDMAYPEGVTPLLDTYSQNPTVGEIERMLDIFHIYHLQR